MALTDEAREERLDALETWMADFASHPGASLMPEWLEAVRELREGHAMLRLREVASPGGWCAERFTTLAGGTVACWQKQGHVGQHHSLSGRYVW